MPKMINSLVKVFPIAYLREESISQEALDGRVFKEHIAAERISLGDTHLMDAFA